MLSIRQLSKQIGMSYSYLHAIKHMNYDKELIEAINTRDANKIKKMLEQRKKDIDKLILILTYLKEKEKFSYRQIFEMTNRHHSCKNSFIGFVNRLYKNRTFKVDYRTTTKVRKYLKDLDKYYEKAIEWEKSLD